jgi:hypothetical protein
MDLNALDLLAAVEAAREATRRQMTGPAIEDDGATGQAGGEQRVQRTERNVAELANRPPLQAAERHMA